MLDFLPALIAAAVVVVGLAPVIGTMASLYLAALSGFFAFGKLREHLLQLPERLFWNHGAAREAREVAEALKRSSFSASHHGPLDLVLLEIANQAGELDTGALAALPETLPGSFHPSQRIHLLRCEDRLRQGDLAGALEELEVLSPPYLAKILWLRPLLWMNLGDPIRVLEEVTEIPDPLQDPWWSTWRELPRATALLSLGQLEPGLASVRRLDPECLVDPAHDCWLQLLLTLLNASDLAPEAEALRDRILAAAAEPSPRPMLDLLGGVLPRLARGAFREAQELAESGLTHDPRPGFDRLLMLATAALGQGRPDQAREVLAGAGAESIEAILPAALLAILPGSLPEETAQALVELLRDQAQELGLEPEIAAVLDIQWARYQDDPEVSRRLLEALSPEVLPEGFRPIWAANLAWYLQTLETDLPRALNLVEQALEEIPESHLFHLNLLCIQARLGIDLERVVPELVRVLSEDGGCPPRWRATTEECLERARRSLAEKVS